MISRHPRDDRVRYHGDVGRAIEGKDEGGIRGRERGQGSCPIGCRGRRREQVNFSPYGTCTEYRTEYKNTVQMEKI